MLTSVSKGHRPPPPSSRHTSFVSSSFSPVFEPACVELAAPRSNPRLCDRSITSHQALVTCRVRREQVSPAPTFSFSLDGLQFEASQPGQVDGEYYQSQFPLCSHGGGEHRLTCRVTNTVINIRHDKTETVVFTGELARRIS